MTCHALYFVVLFCTSVWAEQPLVTLQQGKLRGKTINSQNGRQIFSFQSIPYALPPIGQLRFKGPENLPASSEERSAENIAPTCPQVNYLTKAFEGQEDCLYLNVYTPKLEREGDGFSVMVWLHGGGFYSGSGNPVMYGPELLLDNDIVLVTINYRIGALGFLSLGTSSAPGNYGLKDQVAALHWVQNNIAKFGGNPASVTIFGENSGSASVHYLMLSPLARGLFHRAIAQSGSAYNDWALQLHPVTRAHDLASRVGCSKDDPDQLLQCLRDVEPRKLEEPAHVIMSEHNLATISIPCVEPAGDGSFLTEDPRALLAINDVPLMAGLLTHEGIYHLTDLFRRNKSAEEDLRTNHARYIPQVLDLKPGTPEYQAVWRKIKTYFEELQPVNAIERFVLLNTDADFVHGVDEMVRGVAALNRSPVYYYQFSYDGSRGLIKQLAQLKYEGTCHGDELGYLFTGLVYPSLETATPADLLTISRLTKMWTNFAKTGNPTPDDSVGVQWKSVEAPLNNPKTANTRYLDIGIDLTMKEENLNGPRVEFWRNLIEQNRAS